MVMAGSVTEADWGTTIRGCKGLKIDGNRTSPTLVTLTSPISSSARLLCCGYRLSKILGLCLFSWAVKITFHDNVVALCTSTDWSTSFSIHWKLSGKRKLSKQFQYQITTYSSTKRNLSSKSKLSVSLKNHSTIKVSQMTFAEFS